MRCKTYRLEVCGNPITNLCTFRFFDRQGCFVWEFVYKVRDWEGFSITYSRSYSLDTMLRTVRGKLYDLKPNPDRQALADVFLHFLHYLASS